MSQSTFYRLANGLIVGSSRKGSSVRWFILADGVTLEGSYPTRRAATVAALKVER